MTPAATAGRAASSTRHETLAAVEVYGRTLEIAGHDTTVRSSDGRTWPLPACRYLGA